MLKTITTTIFLCILSSNTFAQVKVAQSPNLTEARLTNLASVLKDTGYDSAETACFLVGFEWLSKVSQAGKALASKEFGLKDTKGIVHPLCKVLEQGLTPSSSQKEILLENLQKVLLKNKACEELSLSSTDGIARVIVEDAYQLNPAKKVDKKPDAQFFVGAESKVEYQQWSKNKKEWLPTLATIESFYKYKKNTKGTMILSSIRPRIENSIIWKILYTKSATCWDEVLEVREDGETDGTGYCKSFAKDSDIGIGTCTALPQQPVFVRAEDAKHDARFVAFDSLSKKNILSREDKFYTIHNVKSEKVVSNEKMFEDDKMFYSVQTRSGYFFISTSSDLGKDWTMLVQGN